MSNSRTQVKSEILPEVFANDNIHNNIVRVNNFCCTWEFPKIFPNACKFYNNKNRALIECSSTLDPDSDKVMPY